MKLLVASKNKKKIEELRRILAPLGFEPICETDLELTLPEVDETGTTFAENARLKALSAMQASGLAAVADDSGICVDALNGAPGIYSARFSGEDATDEKNNQKLLRMLATVPDDRRSAHWECHICVIFPNGDEVSACGRCDGYIGHEAKGENGFGYDPLFLYGDVTFAQMDSADKDAVSHRGKALSQLKEKLEVYLNADK